MYKGCIWDFITPAGVSSLLEVGAFVTNQLKTNRVNLTPFPPSEHMVGWVWHQPGSLVKLYSTIVVNFFQILHVLF